MLSGLILRNYVTILKLPVQINTIVNCINNVHIFYQPMQSDWLSLAKLTNSMVIYATLKILMISWS